MTTPHKTTNQMTIKEHQDQIAFHAIEKRIAEAIKDNNPYKAAAIAYQHHADHDISGLERVVIESKNGAVAFEFSLIPGANITALQKVVLDYGDGFDALMFARHHNDVADIPSLQRVIERSARNMDYGTQFIRDVRGADRDAFIQSVIERGTGRQATQVAELFGLNIEGLQTVMMDKSRTLSTDIANFARRVKGADIAYLQNAAQKHSIEALYHFSDVAGADLRMIHEALSRSERHWLRHGSPSLQRKANNMLKGFLDRHGDKLSGDDSDMVMVTLTVGGQDNHQAMTRLAE